jgi:dihydrofolate synthase/folylpolyglutamate synthase
MTYQQTLDRLYNLQRFGIKLRLANIRRVLKLFGDPQKTLRIIHVGGTNGKGSVGAMISAILQEAGFRIGLYTSPHMVDFAERIRINNDFISEDEVIDLIEKIEAITNELTFFEVVTTMALAYFAQNLVDFAVLEVGMGGRLDATNVTDPIISVITNVDLEHTQYLGNNLAMIAREKAGIIKRKGVVVTSEAKAQILKILAETCQRRKARLFRVGKDIKFRIQKSEFGSQNSAFRILHSVFSVQGIYGQYENLRIPLLGKHQIVNAAASIGAVELLRPDFVISEDNIREGLAKTSWPGRLEVINRSPIVLDGAHNVTAARSLREALQDCFDYRRLIFVLGILEDKDIEGMVAELAPLASRIIVVRPCTSRAAQPSRLAREVKKYLPEVVIRESVPDALRYAKDYADPDDLICVTGSLYTVGEARKVLANHISLIANG